MTDPDPRHARRQFAGGKRLVRRRLPPVVTEGVSWLVLALVASAGVVVMGMQALGAVGCAGICRYDLMRISFWVLLAGLLAVVVLAAVARTILRKRHRPAFCAPLGGTALVIVVIGVSFAILQAGYSPMRERNEGAADIRSDRGFSTTP
ncbi:hypothetical protein [Rathayibacter sp. VKM Ac-2805]|uniref:hypothetical protein n=1 Tax=Rathayibacter sp. VKM Ac-2805 TaxID=2609258 RepID=UPI00131F55A6|nr:hypothetical protein [Rathayibacter sp. VKM Ac-2805]QHC72706.1 hypothetical protein GSU40_02640 [Rathayibacter sp. VKM Ac-2805]